MQQPVITIEVDLLLLLAALGTILYLSLRIRDLQRELTEIQSRRHTDEQEIMRLRIQIAALQRGAIVTDELAGALDVDAIHEFGANGGVKTYILLAGDTYFSMEELQDLAYRLEIDFEALSGHTKAAKAREMVRYVVSRGRLAELKKLIHELRPNIPMRV